jgi:hypothetical protein
MSALPDSGGGPFTTWSAFAVGNFRQSSARTIFASGTRLAGFQNTILTLSRFGCFHHPDIARRRIMNKPNGFATLPAPLPQTSDASIVPFRGLPPDGNAITTYDTRNLSLYMSLLVHEEDGAGIEEIAAGVFGFDLARDREWGSRVTLSHLRRARWVVDQLFPWID